MQFLFNAYYFFPDVVEGKMGEVLGEFRCELDGRFSSVRTAETNLGKKGTGELELLTLKWPWQWLSFFLC